ncbi:MAG: BNR/Asp-box repeat protein [Phycisphaerales bacterium]|nr:BNR/Asp-box repeat protein [Phycisphaerales bacterium]
MRSRQVAAAIRLAFAAWMGVVGFVPLVQAQEKPAAGAWANVTNNVGGEKWGYAGVTTMAAVPGSGDIIAGVSEAGLWLSADGGKTWKKLGEKDAEQIRNRPYQIVFDPADPKIFWESGSYNGPGVFKTTDAGQTFVPLGKVTHVDGIGVDFTDPDRKTLLIGHHEQERSIEKSSDGGQTWLKIGDKLPEKTNFSSDVIVFDAKCYDVNAAGWKQDGGKQIPFAVFRTEDAGATWTKVSDSGPNGPACVSSDGAIYWQTLWGAGLVKSADHGKTWEKLPGPAKANPIEITGGKLVVPIEKQLYASSDGGKTWTQFGPELPFKPSGIVFSANSHALYAWRSTEGKEDGAIVRWEVTPSPS